MNDIAEVEIVLPGVLEVLSVGKGDIKLTVGGDDPEEIGKARRIVEEMLSKGYGLFVEGPGGKLRRVKRFNAKRMEYVIAELGPKGKPVDKAVPMAGSRAKAIGRTAGG